MNLTVVVDGGGSGCRLGAFDSDGTLCATATDGPASLSLGEEQTWRHISRGLTALADQLGKAKNWLPIRLCMGLSGALQDAPRERFLSLLPPSIQPILVTDGHAQLLGATAGRPGVCLAIGTGSVVHWIDESGAVGRAGGWGFPAGDEGSGAWLGSQLMSAYLWYLDGRDPENEKATIFDALANRIGRDVSDVQSWSTNTRSTELASLVPLIVAAAESGDAFANSLLDRGVDRCQQLLSMAPGRLPIYVVGGLSDIYQKRFDASVNTRIQLPRGDVFSGLYSLSQSHQWSEQ